MSHLFSLMWFTCKYRRCRLC